MSDVASVDSGSGVTASLMTARGSQEPVGKARAAEVGKANITPFMFRPGVSGNPGGRSRLFVEMQTLAREKSVHALARLAEMMDSDDERVATVACNSVLDRAFGKPKEQKTEDSQAPRPDLSQLAPHELAALRVAMAALARASTQALDVVQPATAAGTDDKP